MMFVNCKKCVYIKITLVGGHYQEKKGLGKVWIDTHINYECIKNFMNIRVLERKCKKFLDKNNLTMENYLK